MDGFQAYVDINGIVDAADVASPPESDNAAEQSEGNKTSIAPKAGSPDSVGSKSSASKLHNTAAGGSLTRNARVVCL